MKTKWKETMEKMWNAGIILIPPSKSVKIVNTLTC